MEEEKFRQPKLRVLLVEDDAEFAAILKIRLSKETDPPFEIVRAPDLKQALEHLDAQRWDLILLDLALPDSNGIQTFLRIHAQARHTPAVIMTGLDNDHLAIDAVRKGAEDYLVKGDINTRLLLRIIHHAIDRHRIKEKLASVTGRLRETNLLLEKMSLLDPLTEFYNRQGLQQVLGRELQIVSRGEGQLLAAVLDIDDFKKINDSLGHPVGDILLKEIAKKIRESLRVTDHVARVGGDEFVLLLPKTAMPEAVQLAERLRISVSSTKISLSEKETVRITASLAVFEVPKRTASVDELLSEASPLLRRVKADGKNRVCLEDPEGRSGSPSSLHLAERLRSANNFFALKQPIFQLEERDIIGYEFLSRLNQETFFTPDEFFRIAMENNMLTLVDHHCFRSCASAASALPPEMRRHINLFPATIIDLPAEELVDKLAANCPAKHYCFEVSEQQILGDSSSMIGPIQAFKNYGITIAVDDVGFGNTCLESLILLEPDVIKMDKKYVRGIAQSPQVERSLRRVLKVAEDLNAEVIAEGIETEEDLSRLKDLGVKYGQGFLLGMPS
ncbi:MAG: diguanylate cyclase [Candidatus Omnitrophica bacterium]|nr:diguanylate cyclase [Candidatus Omnitrophota bacterium]